jgi:hypothetical protein
MDHTNSINFGYFWWIHEKVISEKPAEKEVAGKDRICFLNEENDSYCDFDEEKDSWMFWHKIFHEHQELKEGHFVNIKEKEL